MCLRFLGTSSRAQRAGQLRRGRAALSSSLKSQTLVPAAGAAEASAAWRSAQAAAAAMHWGLAPSASARAAVMLASGSVLAAAPRLRRGGGGGGSGCGCGSLTPAASRRYFKVSGSSLDAGLCPPARPLPAGPHTTSRLSARPLHILKARSVFQGTGRGARRRGAFLQRGGGRASSGEAEGPRSLRRALGRLGNGR